MCLYFIPNFIGIGNNGFRNGGFIIRPVIEWPVYIIRHLLVQIPFSGHRLVQHRQISCLICLPDKSGNFLAFGAKTRKNTVKSEKTGFGMAITARLRPVFCVFRPKIPRTFYFKLTEQSRREKLAVGGFEPKNDMMQ